MTETIHASFAPDLRTCAITVVTARGGFSYEALAVKQRLIAERKDGRTVIEREWVWTVFIPCAREIGHNLMVAFGADAVWGYQRSDWMEEGEING